VQSAGTHTYEHMHTCRIARYDFERVCVCVSVFLCVCVCGNSQLALIYMNIFIRVGSCGGVRLATPGTKISETCCVDISYGYFTYSLTHTYIYVHIYICVNTHTYMCRIMRRRAVGNTRGERARHLLCTYITKKIFYAHTHTHSHTCTYLYTHTHIHTSVGSRGGVRWATLEAEHSDAGACKGLMFAPGNSGASVSVFVCASVCLSVCLSICLSVCVSVCLCVCLSVYLSVFLPICSSLLLSLSLSLSFSLSLSLSLSVFYRNRKSSSRIFSLSLSLSLPCSISLQRSLSLARTHTQTLIYLRYTTPIPSNNAHSARI